MTLQCPSILQPVSSFLGQIEFELTFYDVIWGHAVRADRNQDVLAWTAKPHAEGRLMDN